MKLTVFLKLPEVTKIRTETVNLTSKYLKTVSLSCFCDFHPLLAQPLAASTPLPDQPPVQPPPEVSAPSDPARYKPVVSALPGPAQFKGLH